MSGGSSFSGVRAGTFDPKNPNKPAQDPVGGGEVINANGGAFYVLPPTEEQIAAGKEKAQTSRDKQLRPKGRASTIFSRRTAGVDQNTSLARRTLLGF